MFGGANINTDKNQSQRIGNIFSSIDKKHPQNGPFTQNPIQHCFKECSNPSQQKNPFLEPFDQKQEKNHLLELVNKQKQINNTFASISAASKNKQGIQQTKNCKCVFHHLPVPEPLQFNLNLQNSIPLHLNFTNGDMLMQNYFSYFDQARHVFQLGVKAFNAGINNQYKCKIDFNHSFTQEVQGNAIKIKETVKMKQNQHDPCPMRNGAYVKPSFQNQTKNVSENPPQTSVQHQYTNIFGVPSKNSLLFQAKPFQNQTTNTFGDLLQFNLKRSNYQQRSKNLKIEAKCIVKGVKRQDNQSIKQNRIKYLQKQKQKQKLIEDASELSEFQNQGNNQDQFTSVYATNNFFSKKQLQKPIQIKKFKDNSFVDFQKQQDRNREKSGEIWNSNTKIDDQKGGGQQAQVQVKEINESQHRLQQQQQK